mmetsp:Transcript_100278/g.281701  ORF Transcript_100278/g.281701 Transcript_100278/m.281701 type:complete len:476 (+) Transcript_100278:113-1540(+)
MSMFGGDNELGNILQEAVKLKSAQMGQKRLTYEKWPFFVQHTLFHGEKDDFKAWRQLPFAEKMEKSDKIKDDGNDLYAKGSYSDAVDKYEEAATMVHYCYSTDPGWRKNNRGIDDDVLVLVVDEGTNEEEKQQYRKLRLACCLNLATCKQKLEKYDEAIVACDVALDLDPDNVKALYRRAEARIRPSSSTAYDLDLAIKDLAKALSADPKNNMVEKLLKRLRGERKVQRDKDSKTFTGMFERGEVYDKGMENSTAPCQSELEMREVQKRIDDISDNDSLEKRCEDAELLRDLYMRNGKEDEAKELNEKIKAAKTAIKTQNETAPPKLNWTSPTPEMIEDAKKHGLDLTDPLVIEELSRLEREGMPQDEDSLDEGSASTSASRGGATDLPLPEVDWGETVPWLRYIIIFVLIAVAWRLLHAGFLRWLLRFVWRHILRIPQILGLGEDMDDERGSMFAAAYRKIAGLFGGADEDGEL